jgi:hypothetical protein
VASTVKLALVPAATDKACGGLTITGCTGAATTLSVAVLLHVVPAALLAHIATRSPLLGSVTPGSVNWVLVSLASGHAAVLGGHTAAAAQRFHCSVCAIDEVEAALKSALAPATTCKSTGWLTMVGTAAFTVSSAARLVTARPAASVTITL